MVFFIDQNNIGFPPEYLIDINNIDQVSLDIETDGLDPIINKIILVQIGLGENQFVFDIRNLDRTFIDILFNYIKSKLIIGHNLKFDLKFLKNYFNFSPRLIYDTMIGERLITNGVGKVFASLQEVVFRYTDNLIDKDIREEFIDNYNIVINQQHINYAATDVKYLPEIKDKQLKILEDQKQLKIIDLEMKLIPVLVEMELTGIDLNKEKWMKIAKELEKKIEEERLDIKTTVINDFLSLDNKFKNCIEVADFLGIPVKKTKKEVAFLENIVYPEDIENWLVERVNLNSPKQMLSILNNVYKTNVRSTNEKIINKLLGNFPIVAKILSYREKEKLFSTYGENFLEHLHPITGKIHAEVNQLGAVSGRFSYSQPNLQNIVRDSDYRECFYAPLGYKFGCFDYSQQELRVFARISNEIKMIEAFINGRDLHQETANALELPRSIAKNLNFAVGYGSTDYGLWKNFNIPQNDAKEYLKRYYDYYDRLKAFKISAGNMVYNQLFSSTLLGRKRYFTERRLFEGHNDEERWEETLKREGVNHIVQGSSADITKLGMCKIYYDNPFGEDLKIILQVHDEIVVLLKDEIVEPAMQFIENCLLDVERPFLGNIPPGVASHVSEVWSKE